MAEYHYKYDPPRRGPGHDHRAPAGSPFGGPGNNRHNNGGLLGMLVEIFVALVAAIPSLAVMLARKVARLLNSSQPGMGINMGQGVNVNVNPTPYHVQSAATSKPESDKRKVKITAGRGTITLGGIMLGLFGSSFAICLAEGSSASALTATGLFTCGGLLSLFLGLRKRHKAKLYLKYLGLIGRRESVSLTTLAQAAGRSRKKVCRELQDMLDQGILPTGYLDLAGDKLVLSTQGIDDEPQEETPEPPKEADENDILRQIKEVNDAIPDPVMSAKIDRIGEITGKILDYQRKNPGKASQLRSFLNYYLPTTLKILRAYAQLDKQGVEGENISAAKVRIEGMMDKVVEGFEKQLDRLFQDEALDITSDVAVLEQMLDKDGLGDSGMTFGGTM